MSIEHKSSPDSQQEAGLTQASSTDIQHAQESEDIGKKLRKINDILGPFELSDRQEDKYTNSLQQLNQDQLTIIQKLDKTAFIELLDKSQAEILPFIIQAQINELKAKGIRNLSTVERKQYAEFSKELKIFQDQKQNKQEVTITSEKSETAKNENLITAEKQETEKNSDLIATEKSDTKEQEQLIDAINKTDAQIAGLRGALLENAALKKNVKITSLREKINLAESTAKDRDGLNPNEKKDVQEDVLKQLKSIEKYLKSPGNLESIAKDLGGPKSQKYLTFKEQMLAIDGLDLQSTFDRVEMRFADHLAMTKLGVDNLDGVNLDNDLLTKVQGDFTIEAGKNERNISLLGGNYKLPSTLDSKYEDQIERLNQQSMKELAPFNKELTTLSGVLNIFKRAEEKGVRFEDAKTHIQEKYPETYNTLGLSGKNSYSGVTSAIQAHMTQLEISKKKVTNKIKQKLKNIGTQSKKEAQEKDRSIEEILIFFHSIGLDDINQNTFTQIIATVNLNPASYGLQQPIDLENGSLGFDLDFGNKATSFLEKKAFIGFINKMLGEEVINEDIAGGIISIQTNARDRIKKLNNNLVGFFLANLKKGK